MNDAKLKALAECMFDGDLQEAELYEDDYLVLTDAQADEACSEYIRESLWAFHPTFLVSHCCAGMTVQAIAKIQELYEDANEPLLRMVDDFAHLVSDAIAADGRGHFLSPYDGEEHEAGDYFIYRVN